METVTPAAATRFDTKELAVMIPLLGSALAIAYEIGSFVPLGSGAFALFNLSEHLLWALHALPVVVGILAAIAISLAYVSFRKSRNALRRRRPDDGRRRKRALRIRAITSAIAGFVLLTSGWSTSSALIIAFGFLGFGLAVFVLLPRAAQTLRLQLIFLIFFGFLAAMASGLDAARAQLFYTCVADFNFKDGARSGVLVRSGERGLLLFDPARQTFTFDKWDDLKSVGWSYLPLRPRIIPLEGFGHNWSDFALRPWLAFQRVNRGQLRSTNCKLTTSK